MALTQVNTDGIKNDAATGAKIPDNAINSEHYTDESIDLVHMSSDSVNESKLNVSNAGTNGQFLQKQSGNTGGLTWADANSYTHPNHSGEVTSTADGAQVVADDVIDEANLKVSNSPTNGYFLSAQSGNTGGLTWAEAGGGKILQVVGSSYNTNALINTTTKTTTSMYQEITPSKAGSKMLFWCAGHYSQNHNGGQHGPQVIVSIYKKIGSGTDTEIHQVTYDYTADNNAVYYSHHFAASYFDNTATSNTSDVIRYTIYAKCLYANHQMRFNPSSYTSFIVQEWDA